MRSKSLAACAAFIASAALMLVPGCGGGVGSGGTGMAIGTVNGFGSVIVDGVRYDDSAVATLREDAPGLETQTQARLGQRAEIRFTDDGVATALMVDATLVGTVGSVSAPGTFTVLGQPVTANADPALGPVTQFAGTYVGAASVGAGDVVEVHGLIVSRGAGFVVQATRVERLAALPAYLKATGVVSVAGLGAFAIGTLRVDSSTAVVVPAGTNIADGAVASVLARATSLTLNGDGTSRVAAGQVRIRALDADANRVTVSGAVSALDSAAQRFTLGGVRVLYAGATVSPSGSALANRYVVATGRRLSDGSLQADAVTVRDGTRESEAELDGNIAAFVSASNFQVRGVAVDASTALLENCPASGLANGIYVELEGSFAPTGVVAKQVHCAGEPSGSTVERTGTAGTVDTTASTFVLTPSIGAAVQVRWTATTFFENVRAATLSGKRVQVQGQFNGSVLVAQKIELDD